MSTVLAAIDNSPAARPVLRAARLLAGLLEAVPAAVHVRGETIRTATAEARACGVPLDIVSGDPVDVLTDALAADEVVLGVFGARRQPAGARPVGHTTLAVVTRANKPVLVVPPEARVSDPGERTRVVVPLDGTEETDRGVSDAHRLFEAPDLDVTLLHVFDLESVPRFWDEPYHEEAAWCREFVARHSPGVAADIRVCRGSPGAAVLEVVEREAFDVIALVWSQQFAGERAQVVRQVLADAHVPVLLLPVSPGPHSAHDEPATSHATQTTVVPHAARRSS